MRKELKLSPNQRGIVLIIGLVMLLLLTIIGLASIRGSGLQEQMAGNMRDHNLAFQAAESALSSGERQSLNVSPGCIVGSNNQAGCYADLNQVGAEYRPVAEWAGNDWLNRSIQLAANTLGHVSSQPRYVIEQLVVTNSSDGSGADSQSQDSIFQAPYTRITSHGLGGTADSEVVLQSTYR